MAGLCGGGGGGPGVSAPTADELLMQRLAREEMESRFGATRGGREGMAGKFGVKRTTTGDVVDNPAYMAAEQAVTAAQAAFNTIQNESISRYDVGGTRRHNQRLNTARNQLTQAQNALANVPKKIDTTKTEYTALTEAERIDPSGQYYDPNYARTLSNLGLAGTELDTAGTILNSVNTDIGEMSRVTGLAETEITNLIQKYKDYDTQTKNQILALIGANDEQATRLSNQINYLTTIQTDVEKTRGLAEGAVQKALAGEVPEWLQQQINEDVNTQIEAQSRRFGAATAGRKGEIATRTKLEYIPQMLGIYDPIASGRTTTARGLTSDITSTGQTKLGNVYELENIKDRFATQGLKNWQTTPALYGGLSDMYGNIATKRTGLAGARTEVAKNRALLADTYNKFGQQGLQNIIDYTNIGA